MKNGTSIILGGVWLALACGPQPVAAQQEANSCFAIRFEWRTESLDISAWEEQKVDEEYRPLRFGDPHGYVVVGREDDCNIAGMRPGQKRRFPLAWQTGSAVGVFGSDRSTAGYDGPPPAGDGAYVEAERRQEGAIIRFGVPSVPTDGEAFGLCGAEVWQPSPPAIEVTEQELADFGNVRKSLQLLMSPGENNCVGKAVATLTGVSPPEAKVLLAGCAELAVGQQAEVAATGEPQGGSYRFRSDPASRLNVAEQGSAATITGADPGQATLHVEYTPSGGRSARTSQPVTVLRIESVNGGQPVPKIGLFDLDGKRTSGNLSVPVSIVPAGAGDYLAYRPDDPGVLPAVGRGNTVLLQGIRVGLTTFQAATSCGGATGPAIPVEVALCDDDVIRRLGVLERNYQNAVQEALQEDGRIRNGKEFEEAERIGPSTQDLADKTASLIVGTLAVGAGATRSAHTGAQIYLHGTNLRDGLSGDAEMAAIQSALLAGKQAVTGAIVAATLAADAAARFGNDLGAVFYTTSRLAQIRRAFDRYVAQLDDVRRRQEFCRTGDEEGPEPKAPESDPATQEDDPTEPLVPRDPQVPAQEPPVPTPTTPGDAPPGDATPGDGPPDGTPPDPSEPTQLPPAQPGPSDQAMGLPQGGQGCGCAPSGTGPTIRGDAAGLEQVAAGFQNLQFCIQQFSAGPLTQYQATLEEWDTVLAGLGGTGAQVATGAADGDIIAILDSLLARTKDFDEQGGMFHAGFQSCPAAVDAGMMVVRSSQPELP
jgi:hypothetical protein